MAKTTVSVSNIKIIRLLLSVTGALILVANLLFIKYQLTSWPSAMMESVIWASMVLFSSAVVFTCLGMILLPLTENNFIKSAIKILFWPLEKLLELSNYFAFGAAPFLTSLFIFGITYICVVLVGSKVTPLISIKAALYLSLVITSILFIYTGKKLVTVVLRWYNKEWNFERLLQFLTPNRVRVYIYSFMLLAYIILNIDKFSGASIVPLNFWVAQKDVVVEVLLTIGVFDALLVIWKERAS